jgi:acyl-CoA synthetase (AMP-forming)/AMP-acid ligase II
MVDHVLARWGGEASAWGLGPRGVDARAARSWLGARQRAGRPVVVLATTLALDDLVAGLARLDLRFRLPAGSVVFETGGFKGREREVAPDELAAGVAERLGVPAQAVVREYGMTELTSQLYSVSLTAGATLAGGDPHLYVPPHQVRVRVVDLESLGEAPAGESGLVAVFDLANLSSAVHVLTEDLGRLEPGGLRLLGRAPGADLRGCSLTVEEMARG